MKQMKVCEKCRGYIFDETKPCEKCAYNEKHAIKPHDCNVDGHVGKKGLITMFVCIHCGYNDELAPELQPSEEQLAIIGGWKGEKGEEEL